MGLANGLEYAIEAARVLRDGGHDRIVLVLHGGGGRRSELERLAAHYELSNVIFSDLVPDKSAVAKIVAASDVCMTIYAATDKEQSWSPNKMFDALAAGRPVLINVPGWLGETIEKNGCGRFVDPRRPKALADGLRDLADHPGTLRRNGPQRPGPGRAGVLARDSGRAPRACPVGGDRLVVARCPQLRRRRWAICREATMMRESGPLNTLPGADRAVPKEYS